MLDPELRPANRRIGTCRNCNVNSELNSSKWGACCDNCINALTKAEERGSMQPQQNSQPVNTTQDDGLPDSFPTHKGNYLVINGRRYEIQKASKGRCRHKVLDWLNEGPVKYPFCPQCGTQTFFDERTATGKEGHKVAKDSAPTHGVHEGSRTRDADEGVAGLSGGDTPDNSEGSSQIKKISDPVVHRTEEPDGIEQLDEATRALVIDALGSGGDDTGSEES